MLLKLPKGAENDECGGVGDYGNEDVIMGRHVWL